MRWLYSRDFKPQSSLEKLWNFRGQGFSVIRLFIGFLFMSAVLASAQTDFRPVGTNVFATPPIWQSTHGEVIEAAGILQLSAPATGASFTTKISVVAGKEYFFAVSVKSDSRVVAMLGGLSMSYHRQGNWQRVSGLVRSNQKAEMELRLDLRALDSGSSATAEVKDLVLQQVERPQKVVPRELSGSTSLVKNGKSMATIVYPENGGRELADKIQVAIHEKTGTNLPLLSDREATEEAWPILKPSLKEQNLILIGNIGNNRAIWSAYNRFLAAEDAYYPGGDGFSIRTAANVFGNHKNQIILGGSSDVGIAKAVEGFQTKIRDLPNSDSLELPWLLEVELGGECKAVFEADNTRWKNPNDSTLPAQTSGYGKVERWYHNAMGYYWSGLPSYLEREKSELTTILSERAHTHQYLVEFLIRAYLMLDESPVFSAEDVVAMDSLILQNFLDFLTVTDLSWMTTFSPPYADIKMSNRHQLAPWYADLIMARFLQQNVQLSGMLKELVDFRLSEKDAVFHDFAANRSGPSMPGIAAGSDYEEFPAAFFRYALENDLYPEFVGSGLAHQALGLDRLNISGARYAYPPCDADVGMWLGAMVQLTGDSRYQWLNKNIPFQPSTFQGRYIAGVHRYRPPADFPTSDPGIWAGIQVVPQPLRTDQTPENDTKHFPHITMRGGFHPEDDSLIVAGITRDYPSGSLIRLEVNGLAFLGGGTASRATVSSANVVRLGQFSINAEPPKESIELLWKKQTSDMWGFEIRTSLSADMDWFRTIVRLTNGQYIFRDCFRANRAGRYVLQVNWRGNYGFQRTEKGWEILTNRGRLHIEKIQGAFTDRLVEPILSWESQRDFQPNEVATIWTSISTTGFQKDVLDKVVQWLSKEEPAPEAVAVKEGISINDETAEWSKQWTYDGLLRPTLLKPRIVSDDVIDFGRVVKLSEIRSTYSGRFWNASSLPQEIDVSDNREEWHRVEGKPIPRPGVKTGNYGEAVPVSHADESLFPKEVHARYVKADGAASLQYFNAEQLTARHPIRLRLIDNLPNRQPLILADNGRFPAFPRPWRDDDFSLALLNPENGKALTQIDVPGPVQGVLVADQKGKGQPEVFVLRMDVGIDVFTLEGKPRSSIDLYAKSKEFQIRYGRDNTRAPAGGQYMPFSFGLWRPNAQSARKWIIGRYGSILFLDENHQLEGVLNFPSYAAPALLTPGIDLDADGTEDALMLERFNLVQIGGSVSSSVRQPDSARYWPEVYQQSAVGPKGIGTELLAGEPIHTFELLKQFGGKPQFVLVARSNYVGIYDARSHQWAFSWRPPAPISAAVRLRETDQRIEWCFTTINGLLWTVSLDSRRPSKPVVWVSSLPLTVYQIRSDSSGGAMFITREGIYLRSSEGTLSKIAAGAFTSGLFIRPNQVVIANEQGQILGLFRKP